MMNGPTRKGMVDEDRAASLLGLSKLKLRELSEASGLGTQAVDEFSQGRRFTYEDLYKLCRLVAGPAL
jgi:hypothetical protein